MAKEVIRCDKKKEIVNFPAFTSDDPLVYMLFKESKEPEYKEKFDAMLHIGALAMLESDVEHLIDSTGKKIFPKLERFKLMFETRRVQFEESTKKGDIAEGEIADLLGDFASDNGWDDEIVVSGRTKGKLEPPKGMNKTGDVLATIEFTPKDGDALEDTIVGIEVKMEASFPFGDPEDFSVETGKPWDKGFKASEKKTAWSQLLETKANRASPFSMIVLDSRLLSPSMTKAVKDVAYLPGIPGFVVIIDSQAGDFTNLLVTYKIARDMAIHHARGELDVDAQILELIVKRMLHYLGDAKVISTKVRSHAEAAVKMNTDVQTLLVHAVQHAEYTEAFLKRYLTTKKLTDVDFAEFYFAHPVAEKLRETSKEEKEFAKQLKEK